jgi:hypothetical protein
MEKKVQSRDITGKDLKQKYVSMSRRAAVAIRCNNRYGDAGNIVPDLNVSREEQQAKLAVAMVPGAAGLMNANSEATLSPKSKWKKVQITPRPEAGDSNGDDDGKKAAASEGKLTSIADVAAAMAFPVQLIFSQGDSCGLDRAIHNMDRAKDEAFNKVDHVSHHILTD